jgi:hypothetical protein
MDEMGWVGKKKMGSGLLYTSAKEVHFSSSSRNTENLRRKMIAFGDGY